MADRGEILAVFRDVLDRHEIEVNAVGDGVVIYCEGCDWEGDGKARFSDHIPAALLDALEARYGEIHAVRVLTCDEWQNEHYRLISACTHAAPF